MAQANSHGSALLQMVCFTLFHHKSPVQKENTGHISSSKQSQETWQTALFPNTWRPRYLSSDVPLPIKIGTSPKSSQRENLRAKRPEPRLYHSSRLYSEAEAEPAVRPGIWEHGWGTRWDAQNSTKEQCMSGLNTQHLFLSISDVSPSNTFLSRR